MSDSVKKQSLVSVIIPCYNRSYVISRSILSVFRQTYLNLEIIIVDDASSDSETLSKLIGSYNDPRLQLFRHHRNRYASVARNTGMKLAKGKFIAFLDSDDEWLPQKLEKQVALLNSLPQKKALIY